MIRISRSRPIAHGALLLFLLLGSERSLKAYADPGSGALIWQVIVAATIGVLYYARKIVAFFRKKGRKG